MITLQVPQKDWETAVKYWSTLSSNDKANDEVTTKQIDFLNKTIFNNEKIQVTSSQVDVPSIGAMTELMNEIEQDIDAAKTTWGFSMGGFLENDVDDAKDTTKEMLNKKENERVKQFVARPVKLTGPCFVLFVVVLFLFFCFVLFFCCDFWIDNNNNPYFCVCGEYNFATITTRKISK